MAVPTLTSITPSDGHPGGKELVRIEGTNFELPPAPPATGYVGGGYPETVEVEFDSRLASEVKVWTSGLITCLVPPYRGDPSLLSASPGLDVDVTIRNLTGPEEDTFTDAFTYKRTNLARPDGALAHVVRSLVLELRRQVIDYVAGATQIDFDGDTTDTLDIVELAKVPALALFGPDVQEDKYRRTSKKENVQNVGTLEYEKKRLSRTSIVSFDATLTGRGLGELTQLETEFIQFFSRNPKLAVDRDSTDPSAGLVEFDMFLNSGPSRAGAANADDVYSATATFAIHGVPIDADDGTRIEWGKMMDDPPDVDVTYEQES
jgi:hypothetical protein